MKRRERWPLSGSPFYAKDQPGLTWMDTFDWNRYVPKIDPGSAKTAKHRAARRGTKPESFQCVKNYPPTAPDVKTTDAGLPLIKQLYSVEAAGNVIQTAVAIQSAMRGTLRFDSCCSGTVT